MREAWMPAFDDRFAAVQETFLEEAYDSLRELGGRIESLDQRPDDKALLRHLIRLPHTLGASGRMLGHAQLAEVCEALERGLTRWLADQKPLTRELLTLLHRARALLAAMVCGIAAGSTRAVDAG